MAKARLVQNVAYFNCKAIGVDGEFLFYCSEKKMNWYLKRKLAVLIENKIIQLNFETNGNGHRGDKFYEQEMENICCCCGSLNNLTAHHIVPYCFRRFMYETKNHSHHDVLPLCVDCHNKYEKYAEKMKTTLCEEFDVCKSGVDRRTGLSQKIMARISGACTTILKYKHLVPEEKISRMKTELSKILGKQITEEDINYFHELEYCGMEGKGKHNRKNRHSRQKFYKNTIITYGEVIMKKIKDHSIFSKMWRNHFVETMSPKFMPPHWSVSATN